MNFIFPPYIVLSHLLSLQFCLLTLQETSRMSGTWYFWTFYLTILMSILYFELSLCPILSYLSHSHTPYPPIFLSLPSHQNQIHVLFIRATLLSSSQHPKNLLLEISKSHLWLPVGCPWPQRLSWGHNEDYPTKSSCLVLSATTQIPINWLRRSPKDRGRFLGLIGA